MQTFHEGYFNLFTWPFLSIAENYKAISEMYTGQKYPHWNNTILKKLRERVSSSQHRVY